jgi:hypothetical protein
MYLNLLFALYRGVIIFNLGQLCLCQKEIPNFGVNRGPQAVGARKVNCFCKSIVSKQDWQSIQSQKNPRLHVNLAQTLGGTFICKYNKVNGNLLIAWID